MTEMQALQALVDEAGGAGAVSGYLDMDEEVIELALTTPATARTERVARMVKENTRKLILMPPPQGGFFWRLTRKRVVKDWLILAKQGLAALPPLESEVSGGLTEEQKRRLDLIAKVHGSKVSPGGRL